MTFPIIITEVIGRSEQGMTRPFIRAANFCEIYYGKGAYAGENSLCCEWRANRSVIHTAPTAEDGKVVIAGGEHLGKVVIDLAETEQVRNTRLSAPPTSWMRQGNYDYALVSGSAVGYGRSRVPSFVCFA